MIFDQLKQKSNFLSSLNSNNFQRSCPCPSQCLKSTLK